MDRWEYTTYKMEATGFLGGKVDESVLEEALNRYGSDGWELVSCLTTNKSYGETRNVVCVFKRLKGTL